MLNYHKILLADKIRLQKYRQAILRTVKKGDVVLDLGCGTAILSLLAIRAGASRVYAIEEGEILEIAQAILKKNGLENRIKFIPRNSLRSSLTEKVDVIVSELFGHLGLEENIISYTADARDKFLKKNGTLIPGRLEIQMAPLSHPQLYQEINFWKKPISGFDFSSARDWAVNNRYFCKIQNSNLLSPPRLLFEIDLYRQTESLLKKTLMFKMKRSAPLHGFAAWFRTALAPGIVLSNSPHSPATHWSQNFFPLQKPVLLQKGQSVFIEFTNIPFQKGSIWNWIVFGKDDRHNAFRFEHSTFRGRPTTQDLIQSMSGSFVPPVTQQNRITRAILKLCNGQRTTEQIARQIRKRFPPHFQNFRQAFQICVRIIRDHL